MKIEEHFKNFITQHNVENYIDLYEVIIKHKTDGWVQIYYSFV